MTPMRDRVRDRALPGGLPRPAGLRRDYGFRPPDGAMELRLAEIAEDADSMPEAVTLALLASLSRLAGAPPDAASIAALCVADRQFLMRELACLLGRAGGWLSSVCGGCGERFDFHVDYRELPVKSAGAGFPRVRVELDGEVLTLRLPTGADQLRLLDLPPERRERELLRSLLESPPPHPSWPSGLAPESLESIEQALDALAPALVLELAAACPSCGESNRVALDPYEPLRLSPAKLLEDVHRLAWHYHWSEPEILALPRTRRDYYLRLVDAARGLVQ